MKVMNLKLDDLELLESMPQDQLGRMIRQGARYIKNDGDYVPAIDDCDRLAWVTMRRMLDKSLKKAKSGKMGGQAKAAQEQEKPKTKSKPKKPTTIKRFVPPTEEQIKEYCREKGYTHVNPLRFIACYESKGWMVGKVKMKSWQASVTKWELDSIDNPSSPAPVNKPTKTVVEQKYQQREYNHHTDPMEWMKQVMSDEEIASETACH